MGALGEGRHKACPYGPRTRRRSGVGAPLVGALGEGRHKACPYGPLTRVATIQCSGAIMRFVSRPRGNEPPTRPARGGAHLRQVLLEWDRMGDRLHARQPAGRQPACDALGRRYAEAEAHGQKNPDRGYRFGMRRWRGGSQDVRFAGMQERDLETENWQDPLDPTPNRMYTYGLGRWLSPDPAGGDIRPSSDALRRFVLSDRFFFPLLPRRAIDC